MCAQLRDAHDAVPPAANRLAEHVRLRAPSSCLRCATGTAARASAAPTVATVTVIPTRAGAGAEMSIQSICRVADRQST